MDEISFSNILVKMTNDEESLRLEVDIIGCFDGSVDDTVQIGKAIIHIVDEMWWNECSIQLYAAEISGTADLQRALSHINYDSKLYETVHDQSKATVYGKIAVLENIDIQQEHRDKGLGSQAIMEIMVILSMLDVNFVIVKPFPFELKDRLYDDGVDQLTRKNEINKGIERLIDFYCRLGFKLTKDYSTPSDEPHMYFDFFKDKVVV